jgi:hypothetical protein
MPDKRAYFKMDVGYLTNPKVAALAARSPRAVLLHLGSIGYAAQHLTDGTVPVPLLLRMVGATKREAALLFDAGLWLDRGDDTAEVHDFLEHQRSAAEAKAAAAQGKTAAHARWSARSNAPGIAQSSADSNAEPNAQRERRESNYKDSRSSANGTASSADADGEFETWWAAYPRKVGKGQARKAWRTARKKTDAETLTLALKRQTPALTRSGKEFTPHPATWLNGERWADPEDPTERPGYVPPYDGGPWRR